MKTKLPANVRARRRRDVSPAPFCRLVSLVHSAVPHFPDSCDAFLPSAPSKTFGRARMCTCYLRARVLSPPPCCVALVSRVMMMKGTCCSQQKARRSPHPACIIHHSGGISVATLRLGGGLTASWATRCFPRPGNLADDADNFLVSGLFLFSAERLKPSCWRSQVRNLLKH